MTKTRQGNNMTDHIDMVYAEIGIELSQLIIKDVVNHDNQTGQQCHRS